MSVPAHLQYAAEKLSDSSAAYGIYGGRVDGNDPFAVFDVGKKARDTAINGGGAALMEAMSTRLAAHSSDDDDSYLAIEEREKNREADCIVHLKQYMFENDIAEDSWFLEVEDELKEIIKDATKKAEAAPYPKAEDALKNVYEEVNN